MKTKLRNNVAVVGALCVGVVIYGLFLASIFKHEHLIAPEGNYSAAITGEYEVLQKAASQVPDVFRGKYLKIASSIEGKMQVIGSGGDAITLSEGSDAWYFSQDFSPGGAIILPGIARNWNEGKIYKSRDDVVVEGYMLEKGLMLFLIPFKDVIEWRIILKKQT